MLGLEQALWKATTQIKEAESKALEDGAPSAPEGSAEELLNDANHELRVKNVQMREMQQKIDAYEGKATSINQMSRIELKDLDELLGQTLFNLKAVQPKN
jgi:hypothetical protein